MNGLPRLWPQRMTQQLGLLLVLALLVSNIIAVLFLQRTGALIHPLSRTLAIERLVSAYHATHGLDERQASARLAAISNGDTRLWISHQADVEPFDMRSEEQRLAREVRERLGLPGSAQVAMQLERVSGAPAREALWLSAGWAPLRLRSSVEINENEYLNAVQHPSGAYEWGQLLAYSLPVTSLPLFLIALFFMRRVVQPVKTLALATERVSRGEWIAPLPLRGPQEARDLTRAFNIMQERIARHVEGRTRMLAALSHDLNTPITELRLQLELLDDGPQRDDLLGSLDELRAMVRETLNFVRGDAVQEPSVRLSLNTVLEDLARRYRTLQQPVQWAGGPAVTCDCRPLALKRALTNLIDNALHHAGDAHLSLHQEADGSARLEILDHGPGIPAQWLTQVFEPFVQLGRTGADRPCGGGLGLGLGLGLAIARSCIQAHGGELILQNRAGAGLCAIVRLPSALSHSA